MASLMSRCRSFWLASLAILACYLSFSKVYSEKNFIKVPLYKHQESAQLSDRLARQQIRAQRRALEESAATFDNVSVGVLALSESHLGVGFGTHYAELYLGIPAQRASVIVDTGSFFTALPCSTCVNCGSHTDGFFKMSKSTTAKYVACKDFQYCTSCENNRCILSQNYVEGSMWQAELIDELVWVGGSTTTSDTMEGIIKTFGFRYPVGCQTKETGLFITQKENGIMGLGRRRPTLLNYMIEAGRVTQNIFTLCLSSYGGHLVLGGVDYSHHTSDVGYTPMLSEKAGHYTVYVKELRINNQRLAINAHTINSGQGVIVDSGTTDSFFDARGSRAFMRAFQKASGGHEYTEKGVKLTVKELKNLPVLSIILSGMKGDGTDDIQLDVPSSSYMTPSSDKGYYFGNFHFSERSGGGASTMIGFDAIFDTDMKRVGFAMSNCGRTPASSIKFPRIDGNNTQHQTSKTVTVPLDLNSTNRTATPQPSENLNLFSNTTASNKTMTEYSRTEIITSLNNATAVLSIDLTKKQEINTHSAFIGQVVFMSLVGVALAVIVWTKRRKRPWSRIPDVMDKLQLHAETIDDEIDTLPILREKSLSPRATWKDSTAKFTIGSPENEDIDVLHGTGKEANI